MVNAVIKNKSECNVGHLALISVKFSMSNIQGSSWLWQFPTWFYKIRSCYDNTLEIENCEFVPFYCPKINLCLYKILMTWVMFFVLYLYIVGEILCNVIAVTKNRDEFFYYYVRWKCWNTLETCSCCQWGCQYVHDYDDNDDNVDNDDDDDVKKIWPVHAVSEAFGMLTCVSCKLVLLPVSRIPNITMTMMVIMMTLGKIMMLIMIHCYLCVWCNFSQVFLMIKVTLSH